MKILYAPDTSDHQNWGCQLMGHAYRASLQSLRPSAITRVPSAWFFQADPQIPELTGLDALRSFAEQVARGQALPMVASALRDCDLVFCNAENFIRPETTKGRRLLLLAYLAKRVFDKPCVLANVTLDLSEPALAEIVAEVFPLLDEVQFREANSLAIGAPLVRDGRARYVPDIAWSCIAAPAEHWLTLARRPGHFNAWPDIAEPFDPAQPYVTLSASSIYALPQFRAIDPVPAYIALCRRLQQEFGQVLLIAPDQPDIQIFRRVQQLTGLPVIGTHFPVRQAIDLLGHARVHLGGRWHPGIFASTGGTPLVAFESNTHKMRSLMQQLDVEAPVFDALDLLAQIEPIVAQAQRLVSAGAPLRAAILARSRELAARVPEGLGFLSRLG